MASPAPQDLTRLLVAWSNGDEEARDSLIPLVYDELRRLAHNYMNREKPGNALQTTALVHEAYLRLSHGKQMNWNNRGHFLAVAAQAMRRILVDLARHRHAQRRGGEIPAFELKEGAAFPPARSTELIALDDALTGLAKLDERKSRVVELRFFGGLSVPETAEVLGVSKETVMRDWQQAKAWLYCELNQNNRS